MTPQLFIFAKRPDMGRAKTRLARDIGPVHAQRHARAMMSHVIRRTRDPRWETVIYAAPRKALGSEPLWAGVQQVAQPAGSLSPRLASAFSGSRRPVIVIGTDCPQVGAADIADALSALRTSDLVFGPASDGGFWLMAAMAPLPAQVFDGVRWSSAQTLSDLSANLSGSIARLRMLTDVDDGASRRRVSSERWRR